MDYFDFVKTTDISNHNLQFYLDGMNEENGEISGVLKRVRRGDYGEDAKMEIEERGIKWVISVYPDIKLAIIKEIGDRHWYTTRLLQEIGQNWEVVEQTNISKLSNRKKRGVIMGHGDERENLINSKDKEKQ